MFFASETFCTQLCAIFLFVRETLGCPCGVHNRDFTSVIQLFSIIAPSQVSFTSHSFPIGSHSEQILLGGNYAVYSADYVLFGNKNTI